MEGTLASEYRAVVFEKRHRWLPELQRQWIDWSVQVQGTRSIDDLQQLLNQQPPLTTLAVLDVDCDPAACLMFLGQFRPAIPDCLVVCLVSEATRGLEWALRELGATSVVDSRLDGIEIARTCQRVMVGRNTARTSA